MIIYVASSWRNRDLHLDIVHLLCRMGHDVYNFRAPMEGDDGFHWSEIDPFWMDWTADQYADALDSPIACHGFASDKAAMDRADCCVLVLPCGKSAHLELGYLAGRGIPCAVLALAPTEPELMVKLCSGGVLTTRHQLVSWVLDCAIEITRKKTIVGIIGAVIDDKADDGGSCGAGVGCGGPDAGGPGVIRLADLGKPKEVLYVRDPSVLLRIFSAILRKQPKWKP